MQTIYIDFKKPFRYFFTVIIYMFFLPIPFGVAEAGIGQNYNVKKAPLSAVRNVESKLAMAESDSEVLLSAGTCRYQGTEGTIANRRIRYNTRTLSSEDTSRKVIKTDTTFSPESVLELETMVVTASRLPTTFSRLTRSVEILSRKELESTPVTSIDELLERVPGVNVMKRGPHGVQSDVSIRGSTFEQTLVLVNGVKICDPQTGHHTLNLPLTMNDIKQIEILKGAGSRMFGPNAFGGVINIITSIPDKRVINVNVSYGQYGLNEILISTSFPIGDMFNQNLSINRKKSSGFGDDTDFEIVSLNYLSSMDIKWGFIKLIMGHINKEFGAYNFYSTKFPNEWEHTTTTFLNTQGEFTVGTMKLLIDTYWRRNKDDFILIRNDPNFYRNIHTTDVFGLDIQSSVRTPWGSFAFGGECNQDRIKSTNLGDHIRPRAGFFTEYSNRFLNRLDLVLGVNGYYIGNLGWKLLPGVDVGFNLTERMRIYSTINKSFRMPTFTEMYYKSPSNLGEIPG